MKIHNALVSNIFDRSQRYFAHVTTVTLSWRVQNIVVIGRVYFTLECFEFSSNFEFDRNMLSGMGARSSAVTYLITNLNMFPSQLLAITDCADHAIWWYQQDTLIYYSLLRVNLLAPGRCCHNFKSICFSNSLHRTVTWALALKLLSGEYHPLKIPWTLVQVMTWCRRAPDICHHMASLGHSELMRWMPKQILQKVWCPVSYALGFAVHFIALFLSSVLYKLVWSVHIWQSCKVVCNHCPHCLGLK